MNRLKVLLMIAVLGVAGWQGYLFYLKKSAPPGMYRLHGAHKPCSYFGDGEAYVMGLREEARKGKVRAEREGDIDEVEYQMAQLEEYDAALRYCW
jgi:hypothetical protein